MEIKILGEHQDLHVQNDILFLADVLGNFQNRCLKIYELDAAKYLPAPGLTWQAALKKTKLKWDLLVDIDMLLMVQKGIRGWDMSLYLSIYKSY